MWFFTISSNGLDHCRNELPCSTSSSTMIPGLTFEVIILGAIYGIVSVLYIAPKGYLGHHKRRAGLESASSPAAYAAPPTEQALGVPSAEATTAVEPAPSPVQAIYETVQPAPAPIQFVAPPAASFDAPSSSTSFGAPSLPKKPTRTYRRRAAPVRSSAGSRAALKPKTKKH